MTCFPRGFRGDAPHDMLHCLAPLVRAVVLQAGQPCQEVSLTSRAPAAMQRGGHRGLHMMLAHACVRSCTINACRVTGQVMAGKAA